MYGSTFGNIFRITTWGESHGKGIGVVVDGCPAGLSLSEEDIQQFLDRRKPGQSRYTTKRNEADRIEILSGVFEGKTTGTPISLMVFNTDQRSRDYGEIANSYRPGHADLNYDRKYGFRDYRGGGRSSGRETIGRVAAWRHCRKIFKGAGGFCICIRLLHRSCTNQSGILLKGRNFKQCPLHAGRTGGTEGTGISGKMHEGNQLLRGYGRM